MRSNPLQQANADAPRSRNVTLLNRFADRQDGMISQPGETARYLESLRNERDAQLMRTTDRREGAN